jgi:hypothetical protein
VARDLRVRAPPGTASAAPCASSYRRVSLGPALDGSNVRKRSGRRRARPGDPRTHW